MTGDWGFTPWSRALYGLTPDVIEMRKDLYLSDVQAERLLNANGVFWEVFMDKAVAQTDAEDGVFPRRYTTIEDGVVSGMPEILFPCVLKPAVGNQGWGVQLLGGVTESQMFDLADRGDFIIEQVLETHEYAREIWPHSSNTIRILTYHDGESPQIAASVHKWGTEHSGWLDNFTQGGITTFIQGGIMGYTLEDTSTLDQRRSFSGVCGSTRPGFYNHPYRYENHPESGVKILGKSIPYWREATEMVLSTAQRLYDGGFLRYIGFDVIITPNGPRIIELNPEPGTHLIQMHMPLLANGRFRRFVEQWDR